MEIKNNNDDDDDDDTNNNNSNEYEIDTIRQYEKRNYVFNER